MRQTMALLQNFTHFPREDGLGTFILDIIPVVSGSHLFGGCVA